MSKTNIYDPSDSEYRTTDTSEAAYLLTIGFTLIIIEHEPERSVFVFANDSPTLQEHIRAFQTGQAQVEVSAFQRNYRKLVRRVKEGF